MAGANATRLCSVDGCGQRHQARGWCRKHYLRWHRYGDPLHVEGNERLPTTCAASGCLERPRMRWKGGDAYCNRHQLRLLKYGSVELPLRITPQPGVCTVDGCANTRRSCTATMCEKHYYQIRRIGRLGTVIDSAKYDNCQSCGKATQRGHKFCSSRCSTRVSRAKAMAANPVEQKAKFIAQYHRRRTKMVDAFVENVNPVKVFERDRWRCHLCGQRISKRAKHPDPMSGSLDHIIPVSVGGEHSYANIKAAHLGCNCSKGSKVFGQLGLPLRV